MWLIGVDIEAWSKFNKRVSEAGLRKDYPTSPYLIRRLLRLKIYEHCT